MKVISLFAGCGGLDLGFERAGFKVVWANEFDTSIHATYKQNHPHTILNTADIRTLTASDIPDCDGIIGGPPCQSWSLGGKSLGICDERGKLVYDYIRIVKEKQPRFFIMENVPGIVSPRHIGSFKQFLGLFETAGYAIKYELLNAADYKIPQERLRVFIVRVRNDIRLEYIFPNPTTATPITLQQAIGDISHSPHPYYNEIVNNDCNGIANHDYYTGPFDQKYMARNRVREWNELSFTIQAQAKNEPIHPQAPKMVYINPNLRIFAPNKENLYRRLSVRECARIQSFPDSFKFIYSNILDGYKMVGNAVPPRLAYYLAQSIKSAFAENESLRNGYNLMLIGYVKTDQDFDTIREKGYYYVRGGNRAGAMQFGQLSVPIRWLLLHRKGTIELYELSSEPISTCSRDFLEGLKFHPQGDNYWLFKIKHRVENNDILQEVLSIIGSLKKSPQIVKLRNNIT